MPISIEICADTPDELAAYIRQLANGGRPIAPLPDLSGFVAGGAAFDPNTLLRDGPGPLPEADPAAETSATEDVTEDMAAAGAAPAARRRTRGRPRKEVQTENGAAQTTNEPASDATAAAPEAAAAAPEPAAAAQPDLFAEDTAPDPAKDKAEALDLLRALYDRDGMVSKINDLLARYGVQKFTMIPAVRGPDLLADARQLDTENPA